VDNDTVLEAWRASRIDELHSDPKLLADAMYDNCGVVDPLAELIAACTRMEKVDSALDLVVLRQECADNTINSFVKRVVDAEERRGEWRNYVE